MGEGIIDQMVTIKVNKIEAAQRQIDTAIRLLFDNEDPTVIHTLSMAGFRILRDLAKQQNSNLSKSEQSLIKPGMEGKFWGSMQSFANFLKHAEKDPDGIIDNIEEEVNDSILLLASLYYQDLGYQFTPEMLALISWHSAIHPDFIQNYASNNFQTQINAVRGFVVGKYRHQQLAEGKEVLKIARAFLNSKSAIIS
jgi:hypothetical protein